LVADHPELNESSDCIATEELAPPAKCMSFQLALGLGGISNVDRSQRGEVQHESIDFVQRRRVPS
jgi:hypothetical protein